MCLTSCEGTLDDIFGEWSRPTGNNGNTKTTVAVKSVTLDQTTLTKAVGDDAVTLTATVDPSDASDKTVTWKSSDASIATVDANGKVTFEDAGTATITATATNGTEDAADDKTATCEVTISAKKVNVESVKLDKTKLTQTAGDAAVTLTATVTPDDATDKTVKWTSSNVSVATVADGVVTFVAAGTAIITATAPNGTDDTADDKTAECAVTVNAAAAKVTTAPTATTGTIAAGSTTALVTAGVADGGTMMYQVTATNAKPTTTDGFSTTVPTAEGHTAGTYYVWFYAKADATHVDSEISASAVAVTVTEVYAANEYNEGAWDGTKVVFTKQTAASVTAMTNTTTTWNAGWYTVSGDVTITGTVSLKTDVHLILQDGAKLTITGQLDGYAGALERNLYIYGQKKGDGKLIVENNSGTAIQIGNSGATGKVIEIHGGEITAKATGVSGPGIYSSGIIVYGGKLTAESNATMGIQFGKISGSNNFEVYGGEVVATSNATSSASACYGITSFDGSATQILKVYGGKVKGTGNGIEKSGNYGSGFGCYVWSGTSGIRFYFSDDGTTWDAGSSYNIGAQVGTAGSTKKRYAKAE